MSLLLRTLRIPASESQMAFVLALCAVTMSFMLWAILWQSDVIAQQHDVIQWLRSAKLGG
jgi:hypothetical protein